MGLDHGLHLLGAISFLSLILLVGSELGDIDLSISSSSRALRLLSLLLRCCASLNFVGGGGEHVFGARRVEVDAQLL